MSFAEEKQRVLHVTVRFHIEPQTDAAFEAIACPDQWVRAGLQAAGVEGVLWTDPKMVVLETTRGKLLDKLVAARKAER